MKNSPEPKDAEMTPEEILLKAADEIARYGHTKDAFFHCHQEHEWATARSCAVGAIARVSGKTTPDGPFVPEVDDSVLTSEPVKLLAATIREKGRGTPGTSFDTIVHFNDSKETTAEDVILMMKEAAQRG